MEKGHFEQLYFESKEKNGGTFLAQRNFKVVLILLEKESHA